MSKNLSKMHHRIMHALPFLASRKRQKGFDLIRHYGDWSLHMRAYETLNYYDLVTLLFLAKRFLEQDYQELGYRDDDGRRVVRLSLDLELLVRERGLHNQRTNRHSVVASLERLMDCKFTVIESNGTKTAAWIISALQTDKHEKNVEVDCNARFLEWCSRGVLVNLGRLVQYGDNGVAVIVDTYLQGTKRRAANGRWMYREWIRETDLFELIDPHKTQPHYKLRQQLRNAFALMQAHGMPQYTYNKLRKRWERGMQCKSEV
jgi:hypothetical protein